MSNAGGYRPIRHRLSLQLLTLSVIVGLSGVELSGRPLALTPRTIKEAIAFGQTRAPRPYTFNHTVWRGVTVRTDVNTDGVVYTPFIRVALASHLASLEGRVLDPSAIDESLIEPVVYVAFRRSLPFTTDASVYLNRGDYRYLKELPPLRMPRDRERILAQWVRSAETVLRSVETEERLADLGPVAAFPLNLIRPDLEIILDQRVDERRRWRVWFFITAADFNEWR